MAETTHKLLAIMFTDIEGYSTLMGQDEEKALQILEKNREIQINKIKKFGGTLIKDLGDGTMVSFSTATDAGKCAIEIQEELIENEIHLRIGIHLGEVTVSENDIWGDGVNIASRIVHLGVAGTILISRTVNDAIKNKGIETIELCTIKLKNISTSVSIFAVNSDKILIPDRNKIIKAAKNELSLLTRVPTWLSFIFAFLVVVSVTWYFSLESDRIIQASSLTPLTTSNSFEGNHSWSPNGNMYAYTSLSNGNADIFIRNRDGGDPIQLTTSGNDEMSPRWSPDGSKIAFISARGRGTHLFWIPSSGGIERSLVETDPDVFASIGSYPWSPSSDEILYSKLLTTGSTAIHKVNIKSGLETQLSMPENGSKDYYGSWSYDGNSITFVRNTKLWVKYLPDEANETQLLKGTDVVRFPFFDSNGKKVIYSLTKGGNDINIWEIDLSNRRFKQITFLTNWAWSANINPSGGLSIDEHSHQIDITLLDLGTNTIKKITDHSGENYYSRFSPDGKSIVYHSNRSGNYEIWRQDLDGTSSINLTDHPSFDFRPDWSPDGEHIAFYSNRDQNYHIWTVNYDGLNLTKASDQVVNFGSAPDSKDHQLKWSPNGEQIGYLALGKEGTSLWILEFNNRRSKIAIPNVASFGWYAQDSIIFFRSKNTNSGMPELILKNIKTGSERIMATGVQISELFINAEKRKIGFTYGLGHYSYGLYEFQFSKEFQVLDTVPRKLIDGQSNWHVHDGSFSPDGFSVIFSTDSDKMNIFLLTN